MSRSEEHQWVLQALSGRNAAHLLASWGLVSLLPDARLRFNDDDVPVLHWAQGEEQLCQTAAQALVERTWGLDDGLLKEVKTTVPVRSAVNSLTTAAWSEAVEQGRMPYSSVLATFDGGACSEKPGPKDIKVKAAALTLPSGKSYTGNCLKELWQTCAAEDAPQAVAYTRDELAGLLRGELRVVAAKPGLRFSAAQAAPRTTSGYEQCDVNPLVDLLAFCGQMLLSPRQRPVSKGGAGRAFCWVLNPVPLDLNGLLDTSATADPALPWARWEAPIRAGGGGARFSVLGHPEKLTADSIGGGSGV
ncbi:hypothetical protein [Actinomyces trachealis]|uniref:hypothetical protein n=1 Tax=Actinomyces trachealis TaxID=2763540 RepID=UPI001892A4F5|nr:hypothetical protein [Actinomyces trachealis]